VQKTDEEENNYIRNFTRSPKKQRPVVVDFLIDLSDYFSLRLTQLFRITYVFFGLSIVSSANLKSFVVRKMYWGRTSFYRNAFQLIIAIITVGALIASISSRTAIFAEEEEGIVASSGIIGNNDMFLQVGTVDAIAEAQSTKADYEIYKYTVKSGDTLSSIAQKYGVKQDTIRWANNIPSGRDTLRVGQVLDIPPMNGVLYTVVAGDNLDRIIKKVQGANQFDLIELNNLVAPDYSVHAGQKLFIPDATYRPPVVATRTTSSGGATYTSTSYRAVSVAPGTFVNPMQQCGGYRFLRGYRYSHTGVDLGHSSGCWIVAAGAGTITKAGWCAGGMGYCVAIRHDNGYSTLYMHGAGKFAVQSGQRVSAGQPILTLGCTGNCYGPHLHLSLAPSGVDILSSYHGRINPAGVIPY